MSGTETEIETTLKRLVMELRTAAVSLRQSVGLLYRAEHEDSPEPEAVPNVEDWDTSAYLRQHSINRDDG